jgi:hypothetical protein
MPVCCVFALCACWERGSLSCEYTYTHIHTQIHAWEKGMALGEQGHSHCIISSTSANHQSDAQSSWITVAVCMHARVCMSTQAICGRMPFSLSTNWSKWQHTGFLYLRQAAMVSFLASQQAWVHHPDPIERCGLFDNMPQWKKSCLAPYFDDVLHVLGAPILWSDIRDESNSPTLFDLMHLTLLHDESEGWLSVTQLHSYAAGSQYVTGQSPLHTKHNASHMLSDNKGICSPVQASDLQKAGSLWLPSCCSQVLCQQKCVGAPEQQDIRFFVVMDISTSLGFKTSKSNKICRVWKEVGSFANRNLPNAWETLVHMFSCSLPGNPFPRKCHGMLLSADVWKEIRWGWAKFHAWHPALTKAKVKALIGNRNRLRIGGSQLRAIPKLLFPAMASLCAWEWPKSDWNLLEISLESSKTLCKQKCKNFAIWREMRVSLLVPTAASLWLQSSWCFGYWLWVVSANDLGI